MPALGTILTAMATPFDERDGSVDEESFVALLHHVCEHGSDGVVVCATTGEASTLTDAEHLAVVELAVTQRPPGAVIVAATGSNDTRHAVALTERATALGADAILSVTPYYVRPNRRGIIRHFSAVAAATDRPVMLYNIPARTAMDMPNDLLAELAQIDGIDAVKQANPAHLALIDGLELYSGNDDMLIDVLDLGGAGAVSVASHIVGEQMRAMVAQPDRRRAIDAELQEVYAALSVTTNPIPLKAALNLLGHRAGTLRLPMVEADEHETEVVRSMLVSQGLLQTART